MEQLRFDNRVAIVTGAGAGLGRSHALELAHRGAKVVVNDLGGARDGTGGSSEVAQSVVDEIQAAGGTAMAHGASVTDEQQVADLVAQTMDRWGRIDVLVNNAGILRDKSFGKMTLDDFRTVMDVHLWGTVVCTHAVWNIMKEAEYGRIVFTTSSSGLYGNFGQSNYGAAKMGVVGLMNTLHLEGAKNNIRVNCLAPTAATRMTEGLLPPDALDKLSVESVTTGLIPLVAEQAPSRMILAAGAGGFATAKIVETDGISLQGEDQSPEAVLAQMSDITDMNGAEAYEQGGQQAMKFLTKAS